jgi:hypothetical protein
MVSQGRQDLQDYLDRRPVVAAKIEVEKAAG